MYQDSIKKRRPVKLKLSPGNYAYYQIIEQWNAMVGDSDVAEWGAPLILRLLDLVDNLDDKDDTIQIFNSPDWAILRKAIGPAEAGWEAKCSGCGLKNIGFGTSGFCDDVCVIDYDRHVVTWQSIYLHDAPDYKGHICEKCGAELPPKIWKSVYEVLKGFTIVRI